MKNGKKLLMSNTPAEIKKRKIYSILNGIEDNYHYFEGYSKAAVALWLAFLEDYDIDTISAAFTTHLMRSKYAPVIHDIYAIIRQGQVSIESRAQSQWRVVMSAVRSHGLNRPPIFDDPITADLIARQFSWKYMCSISDDQIKYGELKRWCEAFELASEHPYQAPALEAPPRHVSALIAPIGQIEDDQIRGTYVNSTTQSRAKRKQKGTP